MTTEIPLVGKKLVPELSGSGTPAGTARTARNSRKAIPETGKVPAIRPPLTATCQYNEAIHRAVITLRRSDTGEEVTQFPPEKVVNYITALLQELRNVDAKA
jgi:hypothetical protein